MGVNLNGSFSSVSARDHSSKLQHSTAGKSSRHKVTLQAGEKIVGVKLQLVTQGQKALHERAATVADARDNWLLGRGTGGNKSGAALASSLAKGAAGVEKKEQKFDKTVVEYRQAAAKFEARLEQQVSGRELKKAHKQLENAEKKVVRAGSDLNQKLTDLEKGIQQAVEPHKSIPPSILNKMYDPPADQWLGKQDKEVLVIRLQELNALSKDLQGQLSVVQGKKGGEREVQLLKLQLGELRASSQKLRTRLGKNKKNHQSVESRKKSEKSARELKARHADFRSAIKELGASRTHLDQAIRTDTGAKSDKSYRQHAESRHRLAEMNISNAAEKLRKAEDNYKAQLGKDRKAAAAKARKEEKVAVQESKQAKAHMQSTKEAKATRTAPWQESQRINTPEQQTRVESKKSRQPATKTLEEQRIPQGTPEQTTRQKSMKDLEMQLLKGHRAGVRELLRRVSGNIQSMRTPVDVARQREFINSSKSLPKSSKKILMKMMNRKIMSLMRNPTFAVKTGSGFVDNNVYGRSAQEKISIARLDALVKRRLS